MRIRMRLLALALVLLCAVPGWAQVPITLTFHTAQSANTTGGSAPVGNYDDATFVITGSFTGQVNFQVITSGGQTVTLQCRQQGSGQYVTAGTTADTYECLLPSGSATIQSPTSNMTSGSVTVTCQLTFASRQRFGQLLLGTSVKPTNNNCLVGNGTTWVSGSCGSGGAVPTTRTVTMTGTTNQISISPSGAQDLSANRTWTFTTPQNIDTAANVQFGTVAAGSATHDTTLTVSQVATLPPLGNSNAIAHFVGGDGLNTTIPIQIDAFGGAAGIIFRRADGTSTALTAVQSGEAIANVTARGYDGTAYSTGNTGTAFTWFATENWTTSAHGTAVQMRAVPSGAINFVQTAWWQSGFSVDPSLQSDVGAGVINAGTGYRIGNAAPSGHVPRGNNVNYVDAQLAASDLSNGTTGSGAVVLATSPTISGTSTSITNVGTFALRDTSAAFDLTLAATSSVTLTAGRTLTLDTGNVAHTLALGTTANTITFPNAASGTVPFLNLAQTWTATQTFATITATGGTHTGLTSLGIRDTSAAFDVTLAATSSTTLTAGRTLTLDVGNVAHTLAFGTTAGTITFPNTAADTVAMLGLTNTFSIVQNFTLSTTGAAIRTTVVDSSTAISGGGSITMINTDNTANNQVLLGFQDATAIGVKLAAQFTSHTVGAVSTDFYIQTRTAGTIAERMRVFADGGVRIGTTATDQGAGTLNVDTNIFKAGTAYTNPDYVLEHWATGHIKRFLDNEGARDYPGLVPLPTVIAAMRHTYALPAFTRERARGPVGLFNGGDALLASVEEAYLYLWQFHERLTALEQRATSVSKESP